MGYTYDEIMKVYDKVVKLNKTRAKLYFNGWYSSFMFFLMIEQVVDMRV